MTHAKDPNAASAVPVPSTPETRRVRVIPHLQASVHADSIFIPLTGWLPAADIERSPVVTPFEGKPGRFSVRVASDEPSAS